MDKDELLKLLVQAQRKVQRDARRAADARPGQVVHHLDGDPTNNELDNLVLVDPRENVRDR